MMIQHKAMKEQMTTLQWPTNPIENEHLFKKTFAKCFMPNSQLQAIVKLCLLVPSRVFLAKKILGSLQNRQYCLRHHAFQLNQMFLHFSILSRACKE